jgi:hypothetical protein
VFISSRLICSTSTCAIERKASSMPELAGATVHGRGGYECFPLTLLFAHSLTSLSLLAHLSAASFASISSTCQKAPPPIRQQQVTMRDVSKKQAANPRVERMAAPKAPLSLSPRRIQGSGKSNGAITFLIRWDSQVVDSTEYCYAVLSQEPCIEFYEEWTEVPQDHHREKDTVAHNPYYKHIDIGYWSLVEEVFLEARDHETLQDYSNETLK